MYLALAAAVLITVIVFIDNVRMKEDIDHLEFRIKDLQSSLDNVKHFVNLSLEAAKEEPKEEVEDICKKEPYWKMGVCTNCPYHENMCGGCDKCEEYTCEYNVPDNYDEYFGEDDFVDFEDEDDFEEPEDTYVDFEDEDEVYSGSICDLNCDGCGYNCSSVQVKEEVDPSHFISPCEDCEMGPCREDMPCEEAKKWKESFYPKHITGRCLRCDRFGKKCEGCTGCGLCDSEGNCPENDDVCTATDCGFTGVDCILDECDHHCEK